MSSAGQLLSNQNTLALGTELSAWYAVWTYSRHEKKVSTELLHRGVETFLPLSREIHRWSDRRKSVEVPLFPGYVFVRIADSPGMRASVLRVGGVANFVGTHNRGTAIPDSQIEDIRQLLAGKVPVTPHEFLNVGQKVRIRGGVLDGIQGILTAQDGNRRLVISIETIQRSISMTLQGYEVEPL